MSNPKTEYHSGDTPPAGTYACEMCGDTNPTVYMVPEMCKKLPICPKCGGTTWMKF